MKIKYIFWAINAVIDFMFCLYHELWHWLFAKLFYVITLGDICEIKFIVTRYPSVELNDNEGITSYTTGMEVQHRTYDYENSTYKFYENIITLAPILGCVLLFAISPYYMWLLYITYINTLWISLVDIRNLSNK